MFETVGGFFGKRKDVISASETTSSPQVHPRNNSNKKQTFSKVFRWRLPKEQNLEPSLVEVVGSFTNWRPVALVRDQAQNTWQVTLHEVQGNRTHHYMILVDGKPVYDHTCDGLTTPEGPVEEQFQLITERGPRVFMLFGQTK